MDKYAFIEDMVANGYQLNMPVEDFANAFSDSMLVTIYNDFMKYKRGE